MKISEKLFELQDEKYREFISRLLPNINKDKIIGIKNPFIRQLGKEMFKENTYGVFISELPHEYYEENNLHASILENIKSYDELINELDRFLPYIDNWATCDMLRPKAFAKNKDKLIKDIIRWSKSDKTYTVRFAVEMLMTYYLDKSYDKEYHKLVYDIKSDEYYIKMMQAWYFATALAKQWDTTVLLLENNVLNTWVHNKTIQKAIESFRISAEQKEYLRTLRRQ